MHLHFPRNCSLQYFFLCDGRLMHLKAGSKSPILIFLLLTQNQSIQMKLTKVLNFECLYENGFFVLHVNISSINKNFEAFKHFYYTFKCTFSVFSFYETSAAGNSVFKDSTFQIENYTVLHQVREWLKERVKHTCAQRRLL